MNLVSTWKQIRTATPFQAPPPQGGASANFATQVYYANIYLLATIQIGNLSFTHLTPIRHKQV
jgi:hypothetical protein